MVSPRTAGTSGSLGDDSSLEGQPGSEFGAVRGGVVPGSIGSERLPASTRRIYRLGTDEDLQGGSAEHFFEVPTQCEWGFLPGLQKRIRLRFN